MSSWKIWQQKRHVLVFLVFLGVINLYSFRVNLSVGIVAMTTDKYETLQNGTVILNKAEFQWNNVLQGYLLSAFFYGYVPGLAIGAFIGHKIGGKNALALTVGFAAFFSLLSPWLAEWSPYVFLASRVCTGLLEGLTYPGIYVLFSKWIPESEKSRVSAQLHGGNYSGTVFSMLFFGYLAEVAGWRSLFWFSGALGSAWLVIWLLVVTESPSDHPSISKNELIYIKESIKSHVLENKGVPWKLLLTSLPLWIASVSMFCEGWAYYTLVTLLPKYYSEVYNFDLSKMGALSALPYIFLAFAMMLIGQLYDRIIARKWVSITVLRKICIGGGSLIEASFMVGTALGENIVGNVVCLIFAVTTSAISKAAAFALPMDMSTQCSGFIYGICVATGATSGMITPTVSGYILSSTNSAADGYRIIFYLTIGILLFGAILFTLFGSAEKMNFIFSNTNLPTPAVNLNNEIKNTDTTFSHKDTQSTSE